MTGPVRVDDDIAWLDEQVGALTRLGARRDAGDAVGEDEIYDLAIRWGTALAGRLPRLVHYHRLGALDEADERRFAALCDQLRALGPLIDRFGLAQPVFSDSAPVRARHRFGRRR